jgi:hypothetical protein
MATNRQEVNEAVSTREGRDEVSTAEENTEMSTTEGSDEASTTQGDAEIASTEGIDEASTTDENNEISTMERSDEESTTEKYAEIATKGSDKVSPTRGSAEVAPTEGNRELLTSEGNVEALSVSGGISMTVFIVSACVAVLVGFCLITSVYCWRKLKARDRSENIYGVKFEETLNEHIHPSACLSVPLSLQPDNQLESEQNDTSINVEVELLQYDSSETGIEETRL